MELIERFEGSIYPFEFSVYLFEKAFNRPEPYFSSSQALSFGFGWRLFLGHYGYVFCEVHPA